MADGIATLTSMFLDRPAVEKYVDGVMRRGLNRAGGFIRKTAQRSIRERKKVSKPGSPPHSHAGQLRELIFYSYDPAARSVVVGPLPFRRAKGVVPPLLEYGGTATRREKSGAARLLRYRPRPFMAPALEIARPRMADWFRERATVR